MQPPKRNDVDRILAENRKAAEARGHGYRDQALKMYPWICGRCAREFTRSNLSELTVHHRNHDHSDNAADGSNWELLCLYCHDNEHTRYLDHLQGSLAPERERSEAATHNPFGGLAGLIKK